MYVSRVYVVELVYILSRYYRIYLRNFKWWHIVHSFTEKNVKGSKIVTNVQRFFFVNEETNCLFTFLSANYPEKLIIAKKTVLESLLSCIYKKEPYIILWHFAGSKKFCWKKNFQTGCNNFPGMDLQ